MYLCAFRPGGSVERGDLLLRLTRQRSEREADYTVVMAGPFAAAIPADPRRHRTQVARWRHLVAVGDVRLDNRTDLARIADLPDAGSDLELVLRAVDTCGERIVNELLGDFAFVFWDPRAQKLLAARDAFGVKALYYRRTPELLLFADRVDALATAGSYDLDYIGSFLTGLIDAGERTVWSDVRCAPAGGMLVQRGTVLAARRYWSAESFTPDTAANRDERYNIDVFLALMREGVRSRIGPTGATWAQLSGGLDSSTVVAIAQSVAGPGQGLAGTITLVDGLGNGDERRYSESVIRRYDLRNEQIRDYWAWQDDGLAPPVTENPRPLYPFYARDRRTVELVTKAGGRVLLSGLGSDHYLTGNFNYITDLAFRGKVTAAVREISRWSVNSRESFWHLAHRLLVNPALAVMRNGPRSSVPGLPAWIDARFASERSLAAKTFEAVEVSGRPGNMFADSLARAVATIPSCVDRWPFGDDLEVRYPFLYRPLVEASLRLPPALRIRPEGTKWILREAMRGLLPEEVRTRPTKGTIDARIMWSLQRESSRLDVLLKDPILAQLGCVRPAELRREVDAARRGVSTNLIMLMSALSLETWLCVRAGRWTALRVRQTAA